ncbi:ATP-binding protein [Arcticibacter sp. MXS-1]|uniref:ATP-binding protein n=1 Tax=Arcticibacter sp. MXS-1 TaxID=3341726 RepID=UPI0035A938C3
MSLENNEDILQPSAARLVESLRDTGYTFTTSVADIVDNSVSANATKINISLEVDFRMNPVLMIADNGDGMDNDGLIKAMTYGSPKRPDPKSLGKFGMGLKTASTSFCRKLTVISRKDGILNIRQWDLDVIVDENKWRLITPDPSEYSEAIEYLDTTSESGSGTVVVWENIDRLVRTNAEGTLRTQIDHIVEDLRDHLSGVFFNFLTRNNSYPNIEININNSIIEPWDPFCRWMNESGDTRVEAHLNNPFSYTVKVNGEEKVIGTFRVNVYILPNKISATAEELDKMRYGLNNQGFHVFREGRMIFSGGWPNRLFVKEPHLNLIRVEFAFDHDLDDMFQIDIKKSRIDFPKELRDKLKKIIAPARNEADRRYRSGNKKSKPTEGSQAIHNNSSNAITKHLDQNTAGSAVSSTDKEKGEAEIRNKYGTSRVKLKFDDSTDMVVQTAESLQDGVLWMPGLIDNNKHAVFLNESHEFYKRFYLAKQQNSALTLAMDSILWSLAEAELCVYSDSVKKNLEDLRISVSRSLRTLSEELPEIDESENEEE